MHARLAIAVAFGVAVLLVVSGSASAFTMTLAVVVVVDRTTAHVGDTVTATVYVINSGALTDATNVSLTVFFFGGPFTSQFVPLTHTATGTYRGSFVITANMTAQYPGGVEVSAQAILGYLQDFDYAWVNIPRRPDLRATLTVAPARAPPGATVHGTITVTADGVPRDADSVAGDAEIYFPGLYHYDPLVLSNVSTGVYAFPYTIPASLNVSVPVFFLVTARFFGPNYSSYSYTVFGSVIVDLPEPFNVWYNVTTWTASYADLGVWVADLDGRPASGVQVALTVPGPGPISLSLHNTTDASGRASFNVTSYGSTTLLFFGWVRDATHNQTIYGYLQSPAAFNGTFMGFQLRRNNLLDSFAPGDRVTLNYTPTFSGAPLNGTQIFYVLRTATALIGYGSVTVPRWDSFVLQFTMPATYVNLETSGLMPNGAWAVASDSILPEWRLNASVGSVAPGGTTRVVAPLPASGGPWYVDAVMAPIDPGSLPQIRPYWMPAYDFSGNIAGVRAGVTQGSVLLVNFTLPSFLPWNRPYLLIVEVWSSNETNPIPYVLRILVYPGGASNAGSETFLVMGFLTALAVAGVAVALISLRRRPPKPTLPSPQDTSPVSQEKPRPPLGGPKG